MESNTTVALDRVGISVASSSTAESGGGGGATYLEELLLPAHWRLLRSLVSLVDALGMGTRL